ncbi:MAG: biopolymer transporter ExbD [Nitrospira sp.]
MDRNIDQINVIPLVDVMLVLLVIVLTTATFISTGQIPVNLAKAKEVGDRKDVPIVVSLTAEGKLFVNDSPVADQGLSNVLNAQPRESAVLVRADKVIVLEKFVALVDEIRALGFQHVSLEVIRL